MKLSMYGLKQVMCVFLVFGDFTDVSEEPRDVIGQMPPPPVQSELCVGRASPPALTLACRVAAVQQGAVRGADVPVQRRVVVGQTGESNRLLVQQQLETRAALTVEEDEEQVGCVRDDQPGAESTTVLLPVVVSSGGVGVPVEPQQREEGQQRLGVTQQHRGRQGGGGVRRSAWASCFVQRSEDVVEQRTAGHTADHMTVETLPELLQV